jgi:hypothetical protein
LVIKTDHPVVQVSVYDAVENTKTNIEAPAAPEHTQPVAGDAALAVKE